MPPKGARTIGSAWNCCTLWAKSQKGVISGGVGASTSQSADTSRPLPANMSAPESVVVVTEPEFNKARVVFATASGVRCLAAPPEEDSLAVAIRENHARHAVVGVNRYRHDLYAALPRGGVVARFGVGHDGIDKAQATEFGLLCTNTPGVLDRSVAEHTVALIAALSRHLASLAQSMRESRWAPVTGSEMGGRTLAVIGCGAIGREVARIASSGFHMHVIGCGRVPPPSQLVSQYGFKELGNNFEAAVRNADYISLHIPATPANVHYLNAERLAMLPRTAWLINTARGAVLDEASLYDALAEGRIGGAALDVFEREPYQPVDPARDLRTLPNVLLTPHVGSNTNEANRRMAERVLHNIALAEAGDLAQMDLLNPEVVSR